MMSFLSISFSASAAGRAFILTGANNKMCSSETESTASDMSDLSYEHELGEGVEVDEGPLQHCRKLTQQNTVVDMRAKGALKLAVIHCGKHL
jgi:hypothetical protein